MVQQHWLVIACLGLVSAACSNHDETEDPEAGPGTYTLDLGRGEDSFWIDTDGVSPEVAGCHIEYSESTCTTVAVFGRTVGEFCQDDGTLVESNPAALACHTHDKDIGHPYVVDCAGWCTNGLVLPNGQRRGFAADTGYCEAVHEVRCDQRVVDSARCACQ